VTRQNGTERDTERANAGTGILTEPTTKRVRKTGRPSTYEKPRTTDEVAGLLARQGLTDAQMAAELGVSERTLYRWQRAHPEFRQSVGAGKELPDDAVEASLFRRALGFTYTEDGRSMVALPDVSAARFWLVNRRPDRWCEVKAGEVGATLSRDLIDQIQTTLCAAVRATPTLEDGDRLMHYLEEKFGRVRG
jgi:transposase-like protein